MSWLCGLLPCAGQRQGERVPRSASARRRKGATLPASVTALEGRVDSEQTMQQLNELLRVFTFYQGSPLEQLQAAVDALRKHFRVALVCVSGLSDAGTACVPLATSGSHASSYEVGIPRLLDSNEASSLQCIVKSQRPYTVADASNLAEPLPADWQPLLASGLRTFIATPIRRAARLVGVITIAHTECNVVTPQLELQVELLASWLSHLFGSQDGLLGSYCSFLEELVMVHTVDDLVKSICRATVRLHSGRTYHARLQCRLAVVGEDSVSAVIFDAQPGPALSFTTTRSTVTDGTRSHRGSAQSYVNDQLWQWCHSSAGGRDARVTPSVKAFTAALPPATTADPLATTTPGGMGAVLTGLELLPAPVNSNLASLPIGRGGPVRIVRQMCPAAEGVPPGGGAAPAPAGGAVGQLPASSRVMRSPTAVPGINPPASTAAPHCEATGEMGCEESASSEEAGRGGGGGGDSGSGGLGYAAAPGPSPGLLPAWNSAAILAEQGRYCERDVWASVDIDSTFQVEGVNFSLDKSLLLKVIDNQEGVWIGDCMAFVQTLENPSADIVLAAMDHKLSSMVVNTMVAGSTELLSLLQPLVERKTKGALAEEWAYLQVHVLGVNRAGLPEGGDDHSGSTASCSYIVPHEHSSLPLDHPAELHELTPMPSLAPQPGRQGVLQAPFQAGEIAPLPVCTALENTSPAQRSESPSNLRPRSGTMPVKAVQQGLPRIIPRPMSSPQQQLAAAGSSGPQQPSSPLGRTPSFTVTRSNSSRTLSLLVNGLQDKVQTAQRRNTSSAALCGREFDLRSLEIIETIGIGGFGVVYMGEYQGAEVAVKVIPEKESDSSVLRNAVELAVLSTLSHPNVVQVLTFFTSVLVVPTPEADLAADPSLSPITLQLSSPTEDWAQEGARLAQQQQPPQAGTSFPGTATSQATAAAVATTNSLSPAGAGAGQQQQQQLGTGAGNQQQPQQQQPQQLPPPDGEKALAIVLEYCDSGTLGEAINSKAFRGKEVKGVTHPLWSNIYQTLLEVALALRYLHSLQLVHRDLKPANVLLKSAIGDQRGFVAKLTDFGLVKVLSEDGGLQWLRGKRRYSGTVTHVPPEALRDASGNAFIGTPADIFAFGILMWEVLTGQPVYPGLHSDEIIKRILNNGLRPTFKGDEPIAYTNLAQRCWATDASMRPTAEDLVHILTQLVARERSQQRLSLGPRRVHSCRMDAAKAFLRMWHKERDDGGEGSEAVAVDRSARSVTHLPYEHSYYPPSPVFSGLPRHFQRASPHRGEEAFPVHIL